LPQYINSREAHARQRFSSGSGARTKGVANMVVASAAICSVGAGDPVIPEPNAQFPRLASTLVVEFRVNPQWKAAVCWGGHRAGRL